MTTTRDLIHGKRYRVSQDAIYNGVMRRFETPDRGYVVHDPTPGGTESNINVTWEVIPDPLPTETGSVVRELDTGRCLMRRGLAPHGNEWVSRDGHYVGSAELKKYDVLFDAAKTTTTREN